jgi:hypothetical protein
LVLNRISTSVWSILIIYWPKNIHIKKYVNCYLLVRWLLDITCHQNAGKNHDKSMPSKSFECMGMSNICKKQWYRGLRNEV